MLNYDERYRSEWTNNSIESYHRRLQQNLTKNPTIRQFVNALQQEEKYFTDLYFESFTYGMNFKKASTSKRKFTLISKSPIKSYVSSNVLSCSNENIKGSKIDLLDKLPTMSVDDNLHNLNDKFNPKLKKPKTENINNKASETSKIEINVSLSPVRSLKIHWFEWKRHSCRIDAFAKVAYFIFFHDYQNQIFPQIIGPKSLDEFHPLGGLLNEINAATKVTGLQKARDSYVSYRSRCKGEKAGDGASISSLFAEFLGNPLFEWKFNLTHNCSKCGPSLPRVLAEDIVIPISSGLLISHGGSCSDSIREILAGYETNCENDSERIFVAKTPTFIPKYFMFSLDYAEDLAGGLLEQTNIPIINIEEEFESAQVNFKLAAIIYFQGMHYTLHVCGVNHPKFLPNRCPDWFYHDGLRDCFSNGKTVRGLLFTNPCEHYSGRIEALYFSFQNHRKKLEYIHNDYKIWFDYILKVKLFITN